RDALTAARSLRALARDPAAMVRTEVAHVWARRERNGCAALLVLATDSAPQTSVTALDAIGSACVGGSDVRSAPGEAGSSVAMAESLLVRLVRAGTAGHGVGAGRVAMHRASHAVVSLARIAPSSAGRLLRDVAAS